MLDEGCCRYECSCKCDSKRPIPASVGRACHRAARVLLKSTATERQLFDVLARPYFVSVIAPDAHAWLTSLLARAEAVTITERITACRDPTDDKFLELAVNGQADLILSGDADLLALNPFRDIPIVPPAVFVQSVAR